jgi:hypothetical protein
VRRLALRLVVALVVGGSVGFLAQLGITEPGANSSHGACFSALRLLRHAIATFEAQHGCIPGRECAGTALAAVTPAAASLLTRQLTQPRDSRGLPDPAGPFCGLLDAIPVNPFTGLDTVVIVPEGADALAFAAATNAGWAFLAVPGFDSMGPLPAGLVLPCGRLAPSSLDRGLASVQDIAFEIEDYRRWR